MKMIKIIIMTASLFAFDSYVHAFGQMGQMAQGEQMGQGQSGQGMSGSQNGQRRGPPPEAMQACQSSSDNASCSFQDREGNKKSGTCWRPSSEMPLACKPSDAPEHGVQGQQGQKGISN